MPVKKNAFTLYLFQKQRIQEKKKQRARKAKLRQPSGLCFTHSLSNNNYTSEFIVMLPILICTIYMELNNASKVESSFSRKRNNILFIIVLCSQVLISRYFTHILNKGCLQLPTDLSTDLTHITKLQIKKECSCKFY